MPFTHEWANEEKTAIHSRMITPWTWAEYVAELETLRAMLDEVTHPVTSIGDYTRAGAAPPGIITHRPALASLMRHPNFDTFILVGVTSALGRSFVDTMEEAHALVTKNTTIK